MTEEHLREIIIEKLKEVHDPEIPVNIWELGLIYEVNVLPINNVQIVMTLTAPRNVEREGMHIDYNHLK